MEGFKFQITSSWLFLKDLILKYIWTFILIILLYILGLLVALVMPDFIKSFLFTDIFERFTREEFVSVDKTSVYISWFYIFKNNLTAFIISLIFSFTIFVPLLGAIYNGFNLGVVYDFTWRISTLSSSAFFIDSVLALLPHGIIEIPVMMVELFLSLLFGIKLHSNKTVLKDITIGAFLKQIVKVNIFILIPLILIAALIEGRVSPNLPKFANNASYLKNFDNPELAQAILSIDDLKALGLDVKEEKLTNVTNKDIISTKEIIAIIYNADLYNGFKETEAESSKEKIYRLKDNNFFIIKIYKFTSEEQSRKFKDLYPKVLEVIKKDDQKFSFEKLEDGLYLLNQDKKTVYIKYAFINQYFLNIGYTGKDFDLFKKIVNAQLQEVSL